jgi:DNA-binding HxlR family transcriptional regulator
MPNGKADRPNGGRAGSRVLSLLANPLHAQILRIHVDGPQRLTDLQEQIHWAARTTLRVAVADLRDLGALDKYQADGPPFRHANQLTPAGEEMLFVADTLERWLARAPGGPISPGSEAARSTVQALTEGWSSTLTHSLASQPSSLTELDKLIPDFSYHSIERRLTWMRVNGQIEPLPSGGRGTHYGVTDWLRHSIAPLSAAGRCEQRHMKTEAAPVTAVEVEAAFMLTIPLVPLPESATGTCELAVRTAATGSGDGGEPEAVGVTVEVDRGKVVSCVARLGKGLSTWALETPRAWFDGVIDGHVEGLRFGGASPQLAADLVNGIHFALFGE